MDLFNDGRINQEYPGPFGFQVICSLGRGRGRRHTRRPQERKKVPTGGEGAAAAAETFRASNPPRRLEGPTKRLECLSATTTENKKKMKSIVFLKPGRQGVRMEDPFSRDSSSKEASR